MIRHKWITIILVGLTLSASPAWAEEKEADKNTIDITAITCKQLMSGDDTDREVGLAYFHGYMAGKKNCKMIDLPAASFLSDRVRDFCLSNPNVTVIDAFIECGK